VSVFYATKAFQLACPPVRWEAPERISLDEFSNLKGHKDFITTVVDLDKKILLDVIKGHKQEE